MIGFEVTVDIRHLEKSKLHYNNDGDDVTIVIRSDNWILIVMMYFLTKSSTKYV